MASIKELYASADWKQEKHVPVIECADTVSGGHIEVTVTVGKEIAHPNTTEHHIAWIEVYFLPEEEKFPVQVGRFEFAAHGASAQGPNTSSVLANSKVTCSLTTEKAGIILATSYCNIHGLWESAKQIAV